MFLNVFFFSLGIVRWFGFWPNACHQQKGILNLRFGLLGCMLQLMFMDWRGVCVDEV